MQAHLENESPEKDRHVAAIDLGSNSFHMVIAKLSLGEIRIVEKLGEKVQLAAGIDADNILSEEAQDRALECLSRFHQRVRHFEAEDVQIVGTNALRVAKNRREFVAKASDVMGFPLEIISGREEARLIYLGVAHTMSDDEGKRLVVDIGGGSTELIIGERFETHVLESLHMGCVSYQKRYLDDGLVTKKNFDQAVLQASRELLNIKKLYRGIGWQNAVGSSGSIKAIASSLMFLGLSEGEITFSGLKALRKKVIELGQVDRFGEIGVKADRLQVFPAGLAILYAVFKVLGIERMEFTSGALREGLLYDIVGRIGHEDVRHRTIQSLQQRYHIDTQQCEIVEKTALHALSQVRKDWGLVSEDAQNLLSWASRIYELGTSISHTQHHKHGAYLITYSDLSGFTDRIKQQLAALVRLHRRKLSLDVLSEFNARDQRFLTQLCILFRIAIILTSSRISEETQFQLNADGETILHLDMGEGWLEKHPLTMANLEYEVEQLRKNGYTLVLA